MTDLFWTVLLLVPVVAFAASEKSPEMYSLWTYAWVTGFSIMGGVASFHAKLRNGHVRAFNFMEFVGELSTSAFAGFVTFHFCESAQIDTMLTAAFVGIAGHAGSRMIFFLERAAQKIIEKKLHINIELSEPEITDSSNEKNKGNEHE